MCSIVSTDGIPTVRIGMVHDSVQSKRSHGPLGVLGVRSCKVASRTKHCARKCIGKRPRDAFAIEIQTGVAAREYNGSPISMSDDPAQRCGDHFHIPHQHAVAKRRIAMSHNLDFSAIGVELDKAISLI